MQPAGSIRTSASSGRRVPADLVYDTKKQTLPTGVRAIVQRARRLLFAAEETELVLQVSPERESERLRVAGQMLDEGLPVAGAAIRLDGPVRVADDLTDDEGEFHLQELPKGSYALEVETPARVVEIRSLDLA